MPWNRREFLTASSLVLAGAGCARPASAQAPPIAGTFREVRGGVGVFLGRGGTIGWVIAPDAVVLVDSQFPDAAAVCLDGLKTRTTRSIDALINTHHHGDHTGGNAVFRPATRTIVAHERAVELQRRQADAAGATQAPPVAYADTTFGDRWRQSFGRVTMSAAHHGAAHTGGDVVVLFEGANVAHMGDLVYNRRHPNIDLPAGASMRNWVRVLEATTADLEADTRYIVGHAAEGQDVVVGRADVLYFRDYLSAVLDHVQKSIASGRSRDEVAALQALPGFAEFQNVGQFTLGRLVGLTYDELTA